MHKHQTQNEVFFYYTTRQGDLWSQNTPMTKIKASANSSVLCELAGQKDTGGNATKVVTAARLKYDVSVNLGEAVFFI